MKRRIAWIAGLLLATLLALWSARAVPSEEGGLMPAGLLVLALAAHAVRRRTTPRSGRTA